MFEYLKHLFKKLKSTNQHLNDLALLKNKTWIRIGENNEKWFFEDGGKLRISINGDVNDGTFELLNGFLIVQFLTTKILLNKNFIYKDILLLQKDSEDSALLAFYDGSRYSQNEFLKFIEDERKKDFNIIEINLVDNESAELIKKVKSKTPLIGDKVLIKKEITNRNQIETEFNIYELNNGVIFRIYFKRKYKIYNQSIVIRQKWKNPSIDDVIIDSTSPIKNGFHKVRFNIGLEIANKVIIKIYVIDYVEPIYPNHKLEIWKKRKDYYSMGDLVFSNNKEVINAKYWIKLFEVLAIKDGKIA